MKTLEIKIPDSLDEHSTRMYLAGVLFEKGILSSGQAADVVGVTKRQFLETIGEYGFSIFSETIDDIQKSLEWLK